MTIGASLFLIAVGAILNFAVTAQFAGIDIQTVGVILMITGGLGLVLTLGFFFRSPRTQREGAVTARAGRPRSIRGTPRSGVRSDRVR
jgi:hypothetical protein